MERVILRQTESGKISREHIFLYNCCIVGDFDIINEYILTSPYITATTGRKYEAPIATLEFLIESDKVVLNVFDYLHSDIHVHVMMRDFSERDGVEEALRLYAYSRQSKEPRTMRIALGYLPKDEKEKEDVMSRLTLDKETTCMDIEDDEIIENLAATMHYVLRGPGEGLYMCETEIEDICDRLEHEGYKEMREKKIKRDDVTVQIEAVRKVLKRVQDYEICDAYAYITYEFVKCKTKIIDTVFSRYDDWERATTDPTKIAELYNLICSVTPVLSRKGRARLEAQKKLRTLLSEDK